MRMTDKPTLLLAIDQGGQSSRVAVYRTTGEQLCCFSSPCATSHTRGNGQEFIEQNPQDILQGIRGCLAKVEQMLGEDVRLIKAAGFAGQGSSLLCWDKNTGEALSPVLSWQDIRGQQYLSYIALTHEQAQQLTGLRASPHYGASKIKWCLEHNEKVRLTAQRGSLSAGPIVSYIFQQLFNEHTQPSKIDPGHAQRTLLWNLKSNHWDQTLLGLFDIPQEILPSCLYHNSHFGFLPLGDQLIPFTASARDQGASLFARGQPDKTGCYVNIGTGAFIQRISDKLIAPEGLLVSPLWLPEPGQNIEVASPTCYLPDMPPGSNNLYAWEATVNGAASAIGYLQDQTGLAVTPEDINRALIIEPSADCYFLNAVGGLSAPWWRTGLQSRFSENLSPDEKILAWLESVIFQIAVNVQLMNQLEPTRKIYISGGLSNAEAVCQKIADLTQIPVIRSDNADATLQGIANMAGGLKASWAPINKDDIFHPQKNALLLHRYKSWQIATASWLDV
jgi:glycerol kinase